MPNGRNWHWHKHGWWCPRHPWPPPWARCYYPIPFSPIEELEMLENMKKDLEENIKHLETRIKELKETVEKEKRQ